jgi:hypothetical protein
MYTKLMKYISIKITGITHDRHHLQPNLHAIVA